LVSISNTKPTQLMGNPGRTGSKLPKTPVMMQMRDKISQT